MAAVPNSLWLQFVDEWVSTAEQRNSKGVQTYKKARTSLKACPLEMQHPSELQQLFGWGAGLVKKLTDELQAYCDANGLPMPKRQGKRKKATAGAGDGADEDEDVEEEASLAKKPRTAKTYIPKLGTGPYALVLALATLPEGSRNGLTKADLINLAQPHCKSSFTVTSGPKEFYTAWNSMKTLENKDIVCAQGRPTKRYFLTDEGWETAKMIKKALGPGQTGLGKFVSAEWPEQGDSADDGGAEIDSPVRRSMTARPSEYPLELEAPDIVPQGKPITSDTDLPTFAPIVLEPGSFTVQLVLDNREIMSRKHRDWLPDELEQKGVKPIQRGLTLGDVLWVAKLHDPGLLQRRGAEGDEIVLDYIVERKRLDDLISSIKDRRFAEQKFRLRKSGIKNVIYLIEQAKMDAGSYAEHVASAIASTQVVHGFFVKKTLEMDETIRYLVSMTKLLKDKYETKPLHLIPTRVITTENYLPLVTHLAKTKPSTDFHITYDAFSSISSKSGTLRLKDVYLKMLMCTRGITGEKALEMQRCWKTPFEFIDAYRQIDQKEGKNEQSKKKKMYLVADEMSNLIGRKKIAKALSVKISGVWGDVET